MNSNEAKSPNEACFRLIKFGEKYDLGDWISFLLALQCAFYVSSVKLPDQKEPGLGPQTLQAQNEVRRFPWKVVTLDLLALRRKTFLACLNSNGGLMGGMRTF